MATRATSDRRRLAQNDDLALHVDAEDSHDLIVSQGYECEHVCGRRVGHVADEIRVLGRDLGAALTPALEPGRFDQATGS